jgi:hypothetical protein
VAFTGGLREGLVWGNGPDADADGVVNGVGDGGGHPDDADLAGALGAHRVVVRVVLIDPGGLDVLGVGACGDVVAGQVTVDDVAEPRRPPRSLHSGGFSSMWLRVK